MKGSEKVRIVEEGIISKSKPKVRKVESDKEDRDLECYDGSDGKPVHVDIEKEVTEGNNATLALLPNKSEENEIHINGETRGEDGNISVRRSNRISNSPEQLGSVPYF